MPNIVQVLKLEMARIGKRQANALFRPARKTISQLRKTVAELKRQNAVLTREVAWLSQQAKKLGAATPSPEQVKGRWVTGKGVKALRRKLGLPRELFAKLVAASTPTVAQWESKKGKIEFRKKDALARIEAVRGMGAREARELLQREYGVDFKKVRKPRATKAVKPTKPAKKVARKTRR